MPWATVRKPYGAAAAASSSKNDTAKLRMTWISQVGASSIWASRAATWAMRVAATRPGPKLRGWTSTAPARAEDLFPDAGNSEISVGLVMGETANYFGLTLDELCSTSRTRQLVTARQIAMYLTRELTDLSLPKIGQAFGGRDHTTVMHANNKISALMQERPAIYEQVQELTSRIKTAARQAR